MPCIFVWCFEHARNVSGSLHCNVRFWHKADIGTSALSRCGGWLSLEGLDFHQPGE
jgi:hypothetical protein